ncbi:Hypothetical predicted protein [Podarcis lilfordi]|uniref:Uncharacterized protein n=1 Tax=Podarcis lilfordi TaxID=74358 RepID=A0AA35PHA1_9SAUR|nr:Hypothetical predicted protein [Podarcis lilfordi]
MSLSSRLLRNAKPAPKAAESATGTSRKGHGCAPTWAPRARSARDRGLSTQSVWQSRRAIASFPGTFSISPHSGEESRTQDGIKTVIRMTKHHIFFGEAELLSELRCIHSTEDFTSKLQKAVYIKTTGE